MTAETTMPSLANVRLLSLHQSDRNSVDASFMAYEGAASTPAWDMHYELEVGILLSGQAMRLYEDAEVPLAAGDIWFCGTWEPHGFRPETGCTLLLLTVWPPLLACAEFPEAPGHYWLRPFLRAPKGQVHLQKGRETELLGLVEGFRGALGDGPSQRLRRRLLLFQMLLLFPDEVAGDAPPGREAWRSRAESIQPAVELALGATRLITNQEAATACAMGRDHFARRFSDCMGVSFARFALRCRLQGAARSLTRTRRPVKRVAADWGFADASHLVKQFERHYLCSPTEYRRRRETLGN